MRERFLGLNQRADCNARRQATDTNQNGKRCHMPPLGLSACGFSRKAELGKRVRVGLNPMPDTGFPREGNGAGKKVRASMSFARRTEHDPPELLSDTPLRPCPQFFFQFFFKATLWTTTEPRPSIRLACNSPGREDLCVRQTGEIVFQESYGNRGRHTIYADRPTSARGKKLVRLPVEQVCG